MLNAMQYCIFTQSALQRAKIVGDLLESSISIVNRPEIGLCILTYN